MVKDIYNPNIQSPTFGQQLQDRFFGTNNVQRVSMNNNYEYQKAINVNKYQWNKEGMIASGINPLANTSGLNGVSTSQAQDLGNYSLGYLGDMFFEVVDMLNPIKQLKELKSFVKDLLKK